MAPIIPPVFVIITGAPASGKASVARELSAELGAVCFLNHDTSDFVGTYLPPGSPGFYRTVNWLRRNVIIEVLASGESIIFTFAFSGSDDDATFLRRLALSAEQMRARVLFVRLTCSREVLLQRVAGADRRAYRKLSQPEALAAALSKYDYEQAVPGTRPFVVSTVSMSAQQAARLVCDQVQQLPHKRNLA